MRLNEEPTAVPATQEPSGAAEQPETNPAAADATHAASLEGEGRLPQGPTQNAHAQTTSAEPKVILGELGEIEFGQPGDPNANTPEGVAHAEPDSTPGEDTNPDANMPVYSEVTVPEVLLEEDGTNGKDTHIEFLA